MKAGDILAVCAGFILVIAGLLWSGASTLMVFKQRSAEPAAELMIPWTAIGFGLVGAAVGVWMLVSGIRAKKRKAD